ncbi:hypothetical protein EDD17DRAFT_1559939, partial [Pisolithus thermaeus]
SGNDWTVNELDACNIRIVSQDSATFFSTDTLPLPDHHPDLANDLTADVTVNEDSYQVVRFMDLAMNLVPDDESAVVDFAVQLLHTMGYAGMAAGGDLRSCKGIRLLIYGQWKNDEIGVCVMDGNEILLLVQEDKLHKQRGDPHAQLIAKAIGAVRSNNLMRTVFGDSRDRHDWHFPDIFQDADHQRTDTSRAEGSVPTYAYRRCYASALPSKPHSRLSEGMQPLDNRRVVIACFEAFKQFVNW